MSVPLDVQPANPTYVLLDTMSRYFGAETKIFTVTQLEELCIELSMP